MAKSRGRPPVEGDLSETREMGQDRLKSECLQIPLTADFAFTKFANCCECRQILPRREKNEDFHAFSLHDCAPAIPSQSPSSTRPLITQLTGAGAGAGKVACSKDEHCDFKYRTGGLIMIKQHLPEGFVQRTNITKDDPCPLSALSIKDAIASIT